jgi:DNA repair protein RadD
MHLRDYQIAAIDAASAALKKAKTALIVAPTGSGKAIISAGIAERAIRARPDTRILALCSTQEILKQNENALNQLAPHIETGIYCAGAGRKDADAQVVFASRDSLGRDPLACGMFDGIVLDESHQAAVDLAKSDTLYSRIIEAQKFRWLVGLTGTPWRLAGGRIWGDGKFFETIAYNIPMRTLIDRGYLSEYSFPKCETQIDTSNVKTTSTGDFHVGQLEHVTGRQVCLDAIAEWKNHAENRRVSLFFCVSRAHGKLLSGLLCDEIGSENVCYIDGETRDRATLGDEIRAGKYRAIVNIGTLTTGFDAPIIDCVVFLRPTQSVSLFIQMSGRGLRRYPGKNDCLFLDMGGNFERFRSIETPQVNCTNVRENAELSGETGQLPAVTKSCPVCAHEISIRATFCSYCGEVFVKAKSKPFTGAQTSRWMYVKDIFCEDYLSAKGNDCKKITYVLNQDRSFYTTRFFEFFVKKNPRSMNEYQERMETISKNPRALLVQIDGKLIKIIDAHY